MSQMSIDRCVAAVALAALLALCALALAGPRHAASAVKPETISVKLTTPVSQQKLLSSGQLRASVGLGLSGSLRVVAEVVPKGGSSAKPVTKSLVVRFKELGSKKIVLQLSARGLPLIADCSAKSLVVSARQIGLAKSGGGPVARATAPITNDSPACAGQGTTRGS
jgi:hypothetical protein